MPKIIVWPRERVELMLQLLMEGKTAGAVGEILGTSRNAVIGRAHRSGFRVGALNGHWVKSSLEKRATALPPRILNSELSMRPKIKYKLPKRPRAVTPKPKEMAVFKCEGISIMELRANTCRWPMWVSHLEKDKRYCGNECALMSAYCPTHTLESARLPRPNREPRRPFVMYKRSAKSPKSIAL